MPAPWISTMDAYNIGTEYLDKPIHTAADVVAGKIRRKVLPHIQSPSSVILCFQPSLLTYIARHHPTQKVNGFLGDLYLLKRTRGQIAVAGNFGIGAPVAAALMEELVAFGARRFIAIGWAGGLQSELLAGDLVVCDRAIRDEGTSHHYLPSEKFANPDARMFQSLCRTLDAQGRSFLIGSSWTTDAPYRETRREVEHYQREGIATVEMEAAALFAVGRYLGVPVGAAFVIADSAGGGSGQPDFDRTRTDRGLRILFDAALDVFSERL